MVQKIFFSFASSMRRHPAPILVFMAFLVLLGAFGASRSQVDNSLQVWQSPESREWLAYQQFLERTGLADPLIVFIPAKVDGVTVVKIRKAIRELPHVSSCQSVGIESVQGKRGSLLSLMPIEGADPAQLGVILAQVTEIMEAQQLESYYLGGVWYLTKMLDAMSAKATSVLFPVVLLVVSAAVLLLCRSHSLLILSCGSVSALLLVGVMGLWGVKMNMVLLALPPLTLILGMAHAIHFSIKTWQEGDTAVSLFCRVAPPCTLSGVTTAMGFGSLLFSSYKPVRELGIWGAVGTMISLLITFVLVPPFLKQGKFSGKIVIPPKTGRFLADHRRKVVCILMLVLIGAGFGVGRLQKGSLILDFFAEDSPVRRNYQVIEDSGLGLTPIEVDLYQQPLARTTLDSHLEELALRYPEITHYFFTMNNHSKQVASLGARLEVPEFFDKSQKVERFTILIKTVSSEATLRIADEMEEFFQSRLGTSGKPYVTGSVPLYTKGQKELFSSMLQSFGTAFLSISLFIGILLRSPKMGLIAMVPNLLPVFMVIAVMGWAGIPLSVATITVASITFGIVVDDTIHFLYSYRNQERGLSPGKRLDIVLQQVGSPIVTTTVVTGTGFLAFLASPFIPLAYFGLLISLSLWIALVCDLTVLPILLMTGADHA